MSDLTTQKTLENCVNNIRAQGLSFNKDGFDFTLSVPDTQDVKSVFGAMTTTIVAQEEQIEELTLTMMTMEQEFKKDQESIMKWAHENIEKLNQKNDVLAAMLNQTRQQLRAMTYNMRGIDDGAKNEDLTDAMKQIETTQSSKPPPQVTRQGSLFATEEGGSLTPSKMSTRASIRQQRQPQAHQLLSQPNVIEEEPAPVLLMEAPRLLKEDAPPKDKAPAPVTSLLAGALQEPPPPSKQKVVVLSADRSPRGLWHWAYRKVAAKHMLKRIGFNFMNTLVDHEETVVSRLEKIEKKLFFLPNSLMAYTDTQTQKLDQKVAGEVARLNDSLAAFDKQVCENFNEMGARVTGVANNLAAVATDLQQLRHTVEEVMAASAGKMQDEIDELARWRQHIYDHKLKALIEQYDDLTAQFRDMQEQADTVTGQVGTSIKNNQRVYDADPAESLTTLLGIDTNMRSMREKLVRLEAGLRASRPALRALHDELLCVLGDEVALEQLQTVQDLLAKDFDAVTTSMRQATTSLKQHDAILAERWKTLSETLRAVREVASISSKIEMMESAMEGKVACEELAGLVQPHVASAIGSALQPLMDTQATARQQLIGLVERIARVEEDVDDAAMEGRPLRLPPPAASEGAPPEQGAGIRNSSEMAGLSELLSGGGDVEAALGPMIKSLVEMYCTDWENGGGGSHDLDDSYDSRDAHDEDGEGGAFSFEPDSAARSTDRDDMGNNTRSSTPPHRPHDQLGSNNDDEGAGAGAGAGSSKGRASVAGRQSLAASASVAAGREVAKSSRQARLLLGAESGGEDSTVSSQNKDGSRSRGGRRGRESSGLDPQELQVLRQEVSRLNDRLSDLNQKKIDVEAVRLLMSQKADTKHLARKVDSEVVTTIEDAVKGCLQNIGDLRQMQGDEISELKADLGRKIKASLKAMFRAKEDEGKGATASVQAVCLACGQDGPIKARSSFHPHTSFLPALNSNSTVGPDVLRGGFKLPVHVPVKVSKYADFLDPELAREMSLEMSIKAAGGLKKSNIRSPEGGGSPLLGEGGFDSVASASQGTGGRKQPLVRASPQSSSSYLEEQSSIRPLFRKGFPPQRSTRPSAYAPERYEPDPSIQVLAAKAPSKK